MADRVDKVVVQYQIDKQSLQGVVSGTDLITQRVKKARDEIQRMGETAKRASLDVRDAFRSTAGTSDVLTKRLEKQKNSFGDLRKEMADYGDQAEKVAAQQKKLAASPPSSARGNGFFQDGGRSASLASAGGGLIRDLGGGAVGTAVSVAGQAGDVATYILGAGASFAAVATVAASAAVAVGALSLGLKVLDDNTKLITSTLGFYLRNQERLNNILSSTSDEAVKSIQELQKEQTDLIRLRDQLQTQADAAFKQAQGEFGGDAGARIRLSRDKDFNDAIALINDLNTKIVDTSRLINESFTGVQDGATAAADALRAQAEAQERLNAAQNKQAQESLTYITIQENVNKLIRDGNYDAAVARMKQLEDERILLQAQIDALNKLGQQAPLTKENAALLDQLTEKMRQLRFETLLLTNADFSGVRLAVEAKKAITDFFSGVREGIDSFGKSAEKFTSVTRKYREDLTRLEEQDAESRAAIYKRYSDRLIQIAEEAAESADKALAELEKERTEALRDASREGSAADRQFLDQQFEARITAQRTERDALRDHLRRLEDIRKSFQDREFFQGLNRDFAGLFFTQREKSSALAQESTGFARGQTDRATAELDRVQDAERERAIERRERAITFQQRLADAQAAYAAELQQADVARKAALQQAESVRARDLNNQQIALSKQVQARQNALNQELELVRRGGQARITLEGAIQAGLIAQVAKAATSAASIFGNIFGGLFGARRPAGRALGGNVSAFQLYEVNERGISSGQESVSASGRTYAFPGAGYFFPTSHGYVNANRGLGSRAKIDLNMPVYLSGSDFTVAKVREIVEIVIDEYTD